MKWLAAAAMVVVMACNNNAETNTSTDTTHTGHTAKDTGSTASMYRLMQDNMHQMMMTPSSGNADVDFAALMKIHHQGAVDMSNLELQQGKDSTVLKMARQIIADQQKEIAVFDSIIANQKTQPTDTAFFNKAMQDMHHTTLTDERSFADREFVQMMIPHHEGAIAMAKTYLANGAKDPLLKKIANNIIRSQAAEIVTFRHLLTDLKL